MFLSCYQEIEWKQKHHGNQLKNVATVLPHCIKLDEISHTAFVV